MNKTRIFVVEDEPLILFDLRETLEDIGYEISGIASTAIDALSKIPNSKSDLVLLDISIDGAQDGVDVAHQLNATVQLPFIFLTAFYDETTLERARATKPSGYIVKPWDENNLKANIEIALAKHTPKSAPEYIKQDSFFIKHKGDMIAVKPEDIVYAESYDNYTYVYTETEKYLLSQTLKKVEEKLTSSGFLRIHKSYLINLIRIDSISEGQLLLSGKEIPIGRSYKKELLERISIL